ncbi:Hercynine oxygenase [Thalassocella blandensis]|nr:Hercynine oxygenase [Thalassocella blandensis]
MLTQHSNRIHQPKLSHNRAELLQHYDVIRRQTQELAEGLSAEDLSAQSMPDASPGKWHLAHTTWFFETFILLKHLDGYREFHAKYNYLFNSYYENVGSRHARPQRGLLTRPSLQDVLLYREYVDAAMRQLIAQAEDNALPLIVIGLHHEMQHQELFLTDILHLLSHNPLCPALIPRQRSQVPSSSFVRQSASKIPLVEFDGGLYDMGHSPRASETSSQVWQDFSYDCEQPRHPTYIAPFAIAAQLTTNAQWLEFIEDGGYDNPLLWLSDGWAVKQKEQWQAPLYWHQENQRWWRFALDGYHEVDMHAPVSHVSFYEADAFARWAGKRLPREHEWELAAQSCPVQGNLLESYAWMPRAVDTAQHESPEVESLATPSSIDQLYGDVWEWTQSAFSPYPGFESKQGALGEYNGKFMANQFVLKGGSCVSPKQQLRASYRNFFYPHQRWQFTGVRLAEDR